MDKHSEIRKQHQGETTPIIAITGNRKRRKNKCLKIGMNDYI
jgi:CheY-like chemotaxis protein